LVSKVSKVKLNGFQCVVMPFFKPVPKSEQGNVMQNVKAAYSNFVKTLNKSMERCMYHDCDVRWRHIGTYEDEGSSTQYILFDLADMQVLGATIGNDEVGKLCNKRIHNLELRIQDKAIPTEVPFACTQVSAEDGYCGIPIFSTLPKSK
jgi:hypothetical protein